MAERKPITEFKNLGRKVMRSNTFLIRNLPQDITEDKLKQSFSRVCPITSVCFCCEQVDNHSFVVVEFERKLSVLDLLPCRTINGKALSIRVNEQMPHSQILCSAHQVYNTNFFVDRLKNAEDIAEQISISLTSTEIPNVERQKVEQLIQSLEEFIRRADPAYRGHRVKLFGSRLNGFGMRETDLDIYVETRSLLNMDEKFSLGQQLAGKLQDNLALRNVTFIPCRACPLVSFTDLTTGLDCDVSFNNVKGILNSCLLKLFSKERRVREIAAVIKLWARAKKISSHEVHGGHYVTSYGLLSIMLFTLMRDVPPVVPKVDELESKIPGIKTLHIDRWPYKKIPTNAQLPVSENQKSSFECLMSFFHFISHFNWEEEAVILSNASTIAKANLRNFQQHKHVRVSSITVIDAFEGEKNVCANIDDVMMTRIKTAATEAVQTLQNISATPDRLWGIAELLCGPGSFVLPVFLKPRPPKRQRDDSP